MQTWTGSFSPATYIINALFAEYYPTQQRARSSRLDSQVRRQGTWASLGCRMRCMLCAARRCLSSSGFLGFEKTTPNAFKNLSVRGQKDLNPIYGTNMERTDSSKSHTHTHTIHMCTHTLKNFQKYINHIIQEQSWMVLTEEVFLCKVLGT